MRIKAIALSAAVISAVGRLSALFAAPTLVYPAENAEVKTVGDKIWDEIHNDAVYLKQATFYQETYTSAYRQSAMREVSTNSLPIVFRWSGASGASVVKAWRTRDLAADQSAAPVFAATTTVTSVTYWDPEVGRDFTWTVEDSSGRATGHFHTAQRAPRIIYADHDPDAAGAACTAGRDLGGWLTADGTKKVRQGLVFRSAALEYCSPGESENLYKPLDYLQDTLGIRLDLDLRTVAHLEKYWIGTKGWNCEWKNGAKLTITESNIGPLVERYCVDSDYAEFPSYTGFTSSVANKKAVWAAFGKIYNSVVVKGEPVIFHCSHGKDRTGSLAYVLLGALGVSEPDARRDFGFTWYLEAKNDTYMGTDGTDGYDGLTLLLNALPSGETFQARCVAYLAACGSAAADSGAAAKIAAFQSAMLEDVEHAEDAYELPATDAFVYNELYWHRVNGGGSFGSEYNGTVASKKGKLSYWYPTYSSTTQYTVPATSLGYNACYYFWPIKDYAYASPSCSYYKAGKIVTVCKSNSYTIDVYGLKAYFTDVDHSVSDRTIIEHREGIAKFDNFDIYFTKYDRTTTKSDGTLMYGGETGNKTLESVYSGVGSIDVWANATLRVSDIRDMSHYATHASIKGQYKAYVRFPEGNCAEARFEAEGGDKPDNILGWFTGGEAGTRQYVKVDNAFLMFKKSGIVNGVAGSLGLEFALGSSNTTSTAAMLQIGGSLKVNAGSTISVDAGGKGAGTYKLISVSGTFTDGAGLTSRSNYSVVNCASGHYGTITKSSTGKTVYVKIQKGEDPGSGGGTVVIDDPVVQPEEPSSDIEAEWGYVKRGLGAFGNEVAVVFTNDTAEAMTWTVPADLTNVQFLVVGGGGGGGGDNCASDGCVGGGGGGGGGVVTGLVYSIAKDAVVTVSVGAGGAGGKAGTKPGTSSYDNYGAGKIGLNSSFAVGGITYVTAKGGGRDLGVSKTISSGTRYQGGQGGSSAGSRAKKTTQGDATQGEIGSGAANLLEAVLFGNKGGAGDSTIEYASAGGGGATESGHSPESSSQGGKGGEGLLLEITGTAEVYGSGGGGGTALTAGVGGAGGTNAGDGHRTGKANGENGVANRGGGGGGGGGQANGGAGGSGIVVFRYVEQILPRVGDDEAGVEIDKVFDVARVSKPIVYPSRPVLRDEDGQQQIVFGGRAVDVPTYYTAALAETAGGFEVSLQLNDRARPVIADGEGDEAPAKALVIEDGVVKIHLENVHSGLYYRLERSTEIGDGADWSEVSEWQRAGEFSSPLGSDPAAFYKVIVSDEPPTGD